jgi:diaminopimelate epimerase
VKIGFVKMQGLGNDFVVIDGVRQPFEATAPQIRRLADRHFGIGCDQVLLVEPAWATGADFGYRIFNADGGEVGQCGNGARCFARFVREQGLSDADRIVVDTRSGRLTLQLQPDGEVRVDMGIPRHAPADIPLSVESEALRYQLRVNDRDIDFGAVSMGNPHAVLTVADVAAAPVQSLGARLECHDIFPEKANIGFMETVDRHHIRLRVFERGSGETLACGSGACAAAVIGIEQGILDNPVRVDLPGGTLNISWNGRNQPVLMTGPAVTVFRGEIDL